MKLVKDTNTEKDIKKHVYDSIKTKTTWMHIYLCSALTV